MKIVAGDFIVNSNSLELVYKDSKDEKFLNLEGNYVKSDISNETLLEAGFVFVPGTILKETIQDEDASETTGDRSFKIGPSVVHFDEDNYKIFINKSFFKFSTIHHKMGDEYILKIGVRVSPELALQPNTEVFYVVMDRVAYTNFQNKIF